MPGPNLIKDEICPFCNFELRGRDAIAIHNRDCATVQCPVCGRYEITGTGVDLIAHWTLADNRRLAMAFAVRRMTDRPDAPRITSDVLKALRDTAALPLRYRRQRHSLTRPSYGLAGIPRARVIRFRSTTPIIRRY